MNRSPSVRSNVVCYNPMENDSVITSRSNHLSTPRALSMTYWGQWWKSLDRSFLFLILGLLGVGIVLSLAASPAIAARLDTGSFRFFSRHLIAASLSLVTIVAVSQLNPRQLRRLSLALFALALVMIITALLVGPEIKGARRWLRYGGYALQPSELAKPAFVILSAWLFAEYQKHTDMPALPIATGLLVIFVGLLALQPDFGQAVVIAVIWGTLFFLAGLPLIWVGLFSGTILLAAVMAYQLLPHVRFRIDSFLDPTIGDGYQTGRALRSFLEGGWLGVGPGEGRIKMQLPDAHSDFIFSVLAEEYGILACAALAMFFAVLTLRTLYRAKLLADGFAYLAVSGLILLIALQALINMAVNAGLIPAKGMTLPFISYGGSSMLGMGFAAGAILALTRHSYK